jgi:hypothetical protein
MTHFVRNVPAVADLSGFGLARKVETARSNRTLTTTGRIVEV